MVYLSGYPTCHDGLIPHLLRSNHRFSGIETQSRANLKRAEPIMKRAEIRNLEMMVVFNELGL